MDNPPTLAIILLYLAFISLLLPFLYSRQHQNHARSSTERFIQLFSPSLGPDVLRLREATNAHTPGVGDVIICSWPVRTHRLQKLLKVMVTLAGMLPITFSAMGLGLLLDNTNATLPAKLAALGTFLIVYLASILIVRRLTRFFTETSAKFRTAGWCEELLRQGLDDTSRADPLFVMQRLAWLDRSLDRQVSSVVQSIPGIADEATAHYSTVRAVLNDLSVRIARAGLPDDLKKELVKICASIAQAALSDRVCGYLDEETLASVSDTAVTEATSPPASQIQELLAVAATFLVVTCAAVGVYALSGSEILASAALVLGSVLFIVMLPRGQESLSWLSKILPGR